jgi:hypothetical protein
MRWYIDFVLANLPGLLTGAVAGVFILALEYHTGWLARRYFDPIVTATRANAAPQRRSVDLLGLGIGFVFFVLFFFFVSLANGLLARYIPSNDSGTGGQPETGTFLANPGDPNTSVMGIRAGESVSFHENKIFVAVNEVTADKVTFIAGSPGYENEPISEALNGHALVFKADNRYDIRVTSIRFNAQSQGYMAEFTVTKLVD